MKNIFLLNTDEEGNLFEFGGELVFEENYKENFRSKFIYITSDELPKLDEWGINLLNNIIFKDKGFTSNRYSKSNFRKIVLTNDPTLISDGVQEVSSVFLSFFAENLIDYVRVEKWLDDEGKRFYSLVFPQKELKYPIGGFAPGNYQCKCVSCKEFFIGDKRAVQCESCAIKICETLEEAAERIYQQDFNNPYLEEVRRKNIKDAMIRLAKWQAERMYSEKEVLEIIDSFEKLCYNYQSNKDWFWSKKSEWLKTIKKS